MTNPIVFKIETGVVTYLKTPAGDAEYKERFPNDNETDIHRKAAKFIGFYINWSGQGSSNKYVHLAGKLGHKKDYRAVSNYKGKLETAKSHLENLADQTLPEAQPPTSNNDVSNFSLLLLLLVSRFNIISHPQ